MLDEKKVKLMTRMAMYEQTQGKEDFKISEYYRKDYVSLKRLYTFFWVTIGYVLAVVIVLVSGLDMFMDKMSMEFFIMAATVMIVGYLALLISSIIATNRVYNKKHQKARMRVKKYNHDLIRLLKMYEKEK